LHYNANITGVTAALTNATTVTLTIGSTTLPENSSLKLSLLTLFSGTTATVTGVSNNGTYEVDNSTQASSTPNITYADSAVL
jgi:hypothetical protein